MPDQSMPFQGRTRTELLVDAHGGDWVICGPRQGPCRCGTIVNTADEWRRHTEQAVITDLWSAGDEMVTSPAALDELPERSVIAVHPDGENTVFRRINFDDFGHGAWCNLTGTFRFTPAGLLPALILERGPR